MNQTELLRAAEEADPILMRKVASTLAVLETEFPLFAKQLAEEINQISEYTTEKLAAVQGYGPIARWGAATGGAILSGLAMSVAGDMFDSAKRGLTKGRNLKRIMATNPELKKFDKQRLQQSYDALHLYAPEFTADPMIGGTLLKAVAELPGNEHTVIKDLINARKSLQEAKDKQYKPGHFGIELPDQADIARDAEQRAHQVRMEADRRNHDKTMFDSRAMADQKRDVQQHQWRQEDMSAEQRFRKAQDDASAELSRKQEAERQKFELKKQTITQGAARELERLRSSLGREAKREEQSGALSGQFRLLRTKAQYEAKKRK